MMQILLQCGIKNRRKVSNNHDIFWIPITIGQALIAHFDLGEIEATGFSTRTASSGDTDGKKRSEKGAIYLPSA